MSVKPHNVSIRCRSTESCHTTNEAHERSKIKFKIRFYTFPARLDWGTAVSPAILLHIDRSYFDCTEFAPVGRTS